MSLIPPRPLAAGLEDQAAEMPIKQALADARARPHLYRLSPDAYRWARTTFEVLTRYGGDPRHLEVATRALRLDEEARDAAK